MKKQIQDKGDMFQSALIALRSLEERFTPTEITIPEKYRADSHTQSRDRPIIFGIPVKFHPTKFELEYQELLSIVAQLQVDLILDPSESFRIEDGKLKTKISIAAFVETFDINSLTGKSEFTLGQPILVLTDGYCYKIKTASVYEDVATYTLSYTFEFDREHILHTKYLPILERAMTQDPDEQAVLFPNLVRSWLKEAKEAEYVDIKRIANKSKARLTKL